MGKAVFRKFMMLLALNETVQLLKHDSWRMACLEAIASIPYPDLWIGGGFIRNAIWDEIYHTKTPVYDVDVIYFEKKMPVSKNKEIHDKLKSLLSEVPWEVYNQAHAHIFNDLPPYLGLEDAVSKWPELATCIACRLWMNDIEIIAPYGLLHAWTGQVTSNPKVLLLEKTEERVKRWRKYWSQLTLDYKNDY